MHRFILCQNYMMFLLVLNPPPPYFEAEYCLFCGRRRVAVARYRMICLVLILITVELSGVRPKTKLLLTDFFRLQVRAGRIILNVKQTQTSTMYILHSLKLMPVHDYFMYRKLILTFKVLNNLTPQYLNVFKLVSQISTRTTRQSISNTLFYIPKARTEYLKRSFSISSAIFGTNFQSLSDFLVVLHHLSRTICNTIWMCDIAIFIAGAKHWLFT